MDLVKAGWLLLVLAAFPHVMRLQNFKQENTLV